MNIKKMVDRFLGWKLPKDFGPDAGISFTPSNGMTRDEAFNKPGWWPVGTNLFTADQAKAMFEHCLGGQTGMDFGQALDALKAGKKVARTGWNGKGLWLELQTPNAHSKMTLPYIFMSYPDDAKTTPGARVPWLASQTDMLAEDWCLVE